ncbi:MAG: valine--tRNA ligase [Flavobacteriales bacterium]|nr:valine--tRNA ligase [Flavobacteriales bacterium]MBK8950279.1 valine--tRNA ligase [Flavobacteriales bacterium]MBK9701042.1 valine--tRNA ligase [Flavobacteriales bacterium]
MSTPQIPKRYDPAHAEGHWYAHWMAKGYFRSVPDHREPYTVVIPPPNVTGVLHMGHMLNNTIQDVLVRRARMQGRNACWVPGTDHASIATEAKVVRLLGEQGLKKSAIGREEFLKHAFAWKEKYGGVILEQLKKLGASCDWDRIRFTMEPDLSDAVLDVFIDLHKKGLVYRGLRMVNWDPVALTAVSDEEVIHKEVNSKLFHIRYKVEREDPDGVEEYIVIATTRPETILGDSAVAVHPEDERYTDLKGMRVQVPLIGRSIPVIFDEHVEREFGTGALKVTPAHDVNDHELGKKHNLETIDILEPNGTLSAAAQLYVGEDRFVVRKKIAKELEEKGFLVRTEDIVNKVGTSERTDAVIEPRLSLQWFVKMGELAKPALEVVKDGRVKLHPQKFVNTYTYWMENVRDWCISRQLWWGQQVPAWYNEAGDVAVCRTEAEAIAQFTAEGKSTKGIKQDEDVVDTWFSSWLWPISVFDGFKDPNNADIKYYYPTNDLVTAPEILFFWVARMIMAGMEYRGEIPFKNVYLTGIVRDKLGRKMSKSLGNSPDPLDLIAKYGADGVRTGMLFSSPAGNDLPFDEGLCEQGRNFSNKIWNAFRLVKGWTVAQHEQPAGHAVAVAWMQSRVARSTAELDGLYDQFRISEALMTTYKLIWDDLCSWYLESIKPAFVDSVALPIDAATYEATIGLFEDVLKLLHPYMPFLTEELWHHLHERKEGEDIIIAAWPKGGAGDAKLEAEVQHAFDLVSAVRAVRNERGLSPKEPLQVGPSGSTPLTAASSALVDKLANTGALAGPFGSIPAGATAVFAGATEYAVLLPQLDAAAEAKKAEEELNYLRGFLASVDKKLSNERFVSGAPPQVLENERKKKADAEAKIKSLEERLAVLK